MPPSYVFKTIVSQRAERRDSNSSHLASLDKRHQLVDIDVLDILESLSTPPSEYIAYTSGAAAVSQIAAPCNLSIDTEELPKTAIFALHARQPAQALLPLHPRQVVTQDQQSRERKERGRHIGRIPDLILRRAPVEPKVRPRETAEAARGDLAVIEPVNVPLPLLGSGIRRQDAQQIEPRDREEGEQHAVGVAGSVLVGQEALETAQEVLDVAVFSERRFCHCGFWDLFLANKVSRALDFITQIVEIPAAAVLIGVGLLIRRFRHHIKLPCRGSDIRRGRTVHPHVCFRRRRQRRRRFQVPEEGNKEDATWSSFLPYYYKFATSL